MNKNLKLLLAKITVTTVMATSLLSATTAFAADFGELDPNCPHNNVTETFNQPSPCELGDVEDVMYVHCQDCGGLIEEKIGVKKTNHGNDPSSTYLDDKGRTICHMCDRPVNEKLDLKEGVMHKDEIEKYMQLRDKVRTEVYSIIDYNHDAYQGWKEITSKGLHEINSNMYQKTEFVTGAGEELEPLDMSKLDKNNFHCKDEHRHLIVDIIQTKNLEDPNASLMVSYICLDCTYSNSISYTKEQIDTVEKRNALAKENKALYEFWDELDLITEEKETIKEEVKEEVNDAKEEVKEEVNDVKEEVKESSFLDSIKNFFKSIADFFKNLF